MFFSESIHSESKLVFCIILRKFYFPLLKPGVRRKDVRVILTHFKILTFSLKIVPSSQILTKTNNQKHVSELFISSTRIPNFRRSLSSKIFNENYDDVIEIDPG
jgi:hypothetical protein